MKNVESYKITVLDTTNKIFPPTKIWSHCSYVNMSGIGGPGKCFLKGKRFAGEVSREIRWIFQFRGCRAVLQHRSTREVLILVF